MRRNAYKHVTDDITVTDNVLLYTKTHIHLLMSFM